MITNAICLRCFNFNLFHFHRMTKKPARKTRSVKKIETEEIETANEKETGKGEGNERNGKERKNMTDDVKESEMNGVMRKGG